MLSRAFGRSVSTLRLRKIKVEHKDETRNDKNVSKRLSFSLGEGTVKKITRIGSELFRKDKSTQIKRSYTVEKSKGSSRRRRKPKGKLIKKKVISIGVDDICYLDEEEDKNIDGMSYTRSYEIVSMDSTEYGSVNKGPSVWRTDQLMDGPAVLFDSTSGLTEFVDGSNVMGPMRQTVGGQVVDERFSESETEFIETPRPRKPPKRSSRKKKRTDYSKTPQVHLPSPKQVQKKISSILDDI